MNRPSGFRVVAVCIGATLQLSAHLQSATEFSEACRAACAKAKSVQYVASFHGKEGTA